MRTARGAGSGTARPQPATLRDVARAAGTTPMTVSNVVNGRAGQVGPELRARVLEACEALGYRPNAGARLLRTNRHMAVGVMIVDPSPYYLSDPFTAALLAGMTDVFRSRGYSILLEGADPDVVGSAPLMRRIATDGFCLMLSGAPAERRALLRRVAALGQPVVLVQEDLPDPEAFPDACPDGCAVLQDDRAGGAMLARHLFAGPARHAAMLAPALAWPAMERREAGLRDVLAERAEPPAFHLVRCADEGFEATQAALADHVARHGMPDVVLGGNDRMAMAAMKWLAGRGVRIPAEVRVTGFNAFEFWRYPTPELTTVRSPAFAIGENAARAMIARIETGAFPARRVLLPVELMPHGSSLGDGAADFPAPAGRDNGQRSATRGDST